MTARILLIFLKDLRRLWPNVLSFWAITAGVAELDTRLAGRLDWNSHAFLNSAQLLTWLACWLLVVSLVQQDRLVGHEQFWLTRPFAWQELLTAKASFLATLVGVPFWVCHRALWPSGPLSHQVPFLCLLLPAVAFAAVTCNLGQSILGFAVMVVALVAISPSTAKWRLTDPNWHLPAAASVLVVVVATAVILLQYSRRRETLARSILLAGAAGLAVLMRF